MCRHLAWLATGGAEPASLHDLLLPDPHSLQVQSWAPRRQRHGTVNVDGFGAGWYVPGRSEPVRFRRAQPIWTDASFASLAPTVRTTAALASVRSATPGSGGDESCCAPFTHGPWLFSHNGRVDGLLPHRSALGGDVADVPDVQAGVDSAVVFAAAVRSWRAGGDLGTGLVDAVTAVRAVCDDPASARLTLLATDGRTLAATTCGEGMVIRRDQRGTLLASEPSDDSEHWQDVPSGCLVVADDAGVRVTAVPDP